MDLFTVEITCVSGVRHVVQDEDHVRAVRLGSPTVRAVCGHKFRPAALATPRADRLCGACEVVTTARRHAS